MIVKGTRLQYYSFIFIVLSCFTISCNKTEIYVASYGKDSNSGTKDSPVATIQKAVDISRQSGQDHVIVRGGTYYDVHVKLQEIDSGLTISSARGEQVDLIGGIILSEWKKDGDWFSIEVPGTFDREWDIHSLIVNDSMRQRARFPEEGTFKSLNKWPHRWQSSQKGWSQKPSTEEVTTLYFDPEDFKSLDTRNAEISIKHFWDASYVSIEKFDSINHKVTFKYKTTHPPGAWNIKDYIVWNVAEGMSRPGQWYLDRTKERIYYWPLTGEEISDFEAMVSNENFVFKIEKGANNISISGFNILCSGLKLKNPGYASNKVDAGAIFGYGISGLSLDNLHISNVSGWAMFLESCSNIQINQCKMENTGAGGVKFNGRNLTISNCEIHDVGRIFLSSVGIYGEGSHNTISHCELYNMPYCAINGIGDFSVAEYNLIYNFKQHLKDGGAIYSNKADSSLYQYNAAMMPSGSRNDGRTYYFDEQSRYSKIENNLAVNTHSPFSIHMANDIEVSNNLFFDQGEQILKYRMSSDIHLTNNKFICDSVIFSGPTGDALSVDKELLNHIYQKYYEANGVSKLNGNTFYSDVVFQHQIELYTVASIRKVPVEDFNEIKHPITYQEFIGMIPEEFEQVGYRNNFWSILNEMSLE